MKLLSTDEILDWGLDLVGFPTNGGAVKRSTRLRRFKAHYGSNPIVISELFEALQTTDIEEARIEVKANKDVDNFLLSIYYLKVYPVEERMAGAFGKHEDTVRKWIWYYIERIQALLPEVIFWPEEWNEPDDSFDVPVFLISVDGTHCRINEPHHPLWSKNPKYYSHKFNKAALNYEVALSVYENKVVWIKGPYKASTHDITIFAGEDGEGGECLMDKIPEGHLAIADRGYNKLTLDMIATPNRQDDPDVKKFKSRARARQESFNCRLKNYGALDDRFRHGEKKHKAVFEAICVICQFQLNFGSPLFEV